MKRFLALALPCVLGALGCSAKPPTSESPRPATVATPGPAAPGHVVTEHFHSDALGVDKAVMVYLPRGYEAQPAKHWPVFYYLHGSSANETDWVQQGKLDATANELALGAIVVMPDADDGFYVDSPSKIDYDKCMKDGTGLYDPAQPHAENCVRARSYESYIAKDLVGWVDAHYRTIQRRDGRAIAGLSMGGFGAMAIGLRHPDEFAAAASHSGAVALLFRGPHPFVAGKQVELLTDVSEPSASGSRILAWIALMLGPNLADWKAHDVVELAGALPPGKLALYFDCGAEDENRLEDNLQYVHEALTAKHVDHAFFIVPGKHSFELWAQRLPHSLAFLRDHTAKPE